MTNEKTIEEKLKESKFLIGRIPNRGLVEDMEHAGISDGIQAVYLQNEIIIDYLQEIYQNQSEVKK